MFDRYDAFDSLKNKGLKNTKIFVQRLMVRITEGQYKIKNDRRNKYPKTCNLLNSYNFLSCVTKVKIQYYSYFLNFYYPTHFFHMHLLL